MKLTIGVTESGKAFALPSDAVTQKIALLARTGGGKTYAAKVLAEEFMQAKFPIVCIDPIGVWWGLRAEGESRGFEILIAGGDHQDIPLEPASGKIIADFFVRERVPMILDLSLFGENEMRRFVADFATELYRHNRDAMHLFVDEADEFAPQGGGKSMGAEVGRCLGAMQNVVRRGRARGIGCTLITQRSAVLSKSVLTQTEALFCFQTTGPQDLAAIDEWIKYHGTKDERNQIMGSLTKLQRGECWFYSPAWIKTLERVRIRKLKTFDSSRTPGPGEAVKPPKSLADVNLPELTDRMKSCVEQAKANDPKELRAEIGRLKAQLAAKPETQADPEAIQRAVDEAVRRERQSIAAEYGHRERKYTSAIATLRSRMSKASAELDLNGFDLPEPLELSGRPMPVVHCGGVIVRNEDVRKAKPAATPISGELTKYQESLLTIVIQRSPVPTSRSQIATLAGKSVKSSAFSPNLNSLVDGGLIEKTKHGYIATDLAISTMGNIESIPRFGPDAIEHWKKKLPAYESAIMDAFARVRGPMSNDDISRATGRSVTSSAFRPAIRNLRELGLITSNGDSHELAEHLR